MALPGSSCGVSWTGEVASTGWRFPGLAGAVRRFVAGRELCRRDRYYVLGVMDAWLSWFRPDKANLIHRLRYSNGALTAVLSERYADLLGLGIDPFVEER